MGIGRNKMMKSRKMVMTLKESISLSKSMHVYGNVASGIQNALSGLPLVCQRSTMSSLSRYDEVNGPTSEENCQDVGQDHERLEYDAENDRP